MYSILYRIKKKLKCFLFCKGTALFISSLSLKLKHFKSDIIQSDNIITMSSFSNNNNNNNNNSIVYRSKLFSSAEQPKSNISNTKPVYKTFCKVCQDAGKSEKEFTNHSVRDKSGKTICPTLLAQECRHCYKNGHTVKYCPLLKARSEPVKAEIVKPKQVAAAKPNNVFMVLESDSEEEEEKQSIPMIIAPCLPDNVFIASESFPQLVAAPTNQRPVFSYGKIIQKENDPETYANAKEEEMKLKAEKYAQEREAKRKAEVIEWAKAQTKAEAEREAREERRKKINATKCRWIDAESSDEEDDEEEEVYNQKQQVEVVDNSAW